VKQTTHLHRQSTLRIRGSIPSLPCLCSWSAQGKLRDIILLYPTALRRESSCGYVQNNIQNYNFLLCNAQVSENIKKQNILKPVT
jgi:hypothetical protein